MSQDPGLAIDKRVVRVDDAGDGILNVAGDLIEYEIDVTNTGNQTLTNVTVTDPLTGGLLTTIASLAPGATETVPASYAITQLDIDKTATADSDQTDPVSDSEQVPLSQDPGLAIDKRVVRVDDAGDGILNVAGDLIEYEIDVTNTGNQTLTNVTVTDPLTGGLLTTIASLTPGATETVPASYAITQADLDNNGGGDGDIDNTATADSDETDPVDDSEEVPLAPAPDISLTKTGTFNDENGDTYAQPGETISYLFTVENTGNVTLSDLSLIDPDLTTVTAFSDVANNGVDILEVGDIETATGTYSLMQADIDAGEYTNFAEVDSDDPNGDPVTDDDSDTQTLVPELICNVVSSTDPSCAPVNGPSDDGSITISVTGGMGAYNFALNGVSTIPTSNPDGTFTFDMLTDGSYDIVVTDDQGSSTCDNVMLTEPTAIMLTATATDASCNGFSDGTVDLTVSGGTPPYSYSWSTGATTQVLNGVGAGTYSVVVTDANGCTANASATVGEPPVLIAVATATDASCNGFSDGTVDLTVSGGTPPYSYSWSTGATTQDLNGVGAGTYSVVVTDANGCTASASATVGEPPVLIAGASATDASCNGFSDGTATVVGSGGTPPYDYQWDSNAGNQATQTATGLSAGTYSVVVTDANGCTATTSATVGEPPVLTAVATATDASCNGFSDGTVDLTVSGGTPPYSYSWSTGATTQDLSGVSAGTYSVVVTDANGCTANASATVGEPPALIAGATSTDASCNGFSDGTATASASGGTPPYDYQWDASAGSQTTATAVGLFAGTYSVVVSDANGCTATTSATVGEPTQLTCTITNPIPSSETVCQDETVELMVVANGGTPGDPIPYTYEWGSDDPNLIIDVDNEYDNRPLISGFSVGPVEIYVIVTDANGCTTSCLTTITADNCTEACTWTPGFWKNHPDEVCAVLNGEVTGKGKKNKTCEGTFDLFQIEICGQEYNLTPDQVSCLFAYSGDTRRGNSKNLKCMNGETDLELIVANFEDVPNGITLLHHLLAAKLNLLANAKYKGLTGLGNINVANLNCIDNLNGYDVVDYYEGVTIQYLIDEIADFDFCVNAFTANYFSTFIEPLTFFNECVDDCGLPSNLDNTVGESLSDHTIETVITKDAEFEVERKFAVEAYPNPTSGFVIVKIDNLLHENSVLEVFDAFGKLVKTFDIPSKGDVKQEILLPDEVQDGLFIVRVRNQEQFKTISLFVAKK